MLLKKFISGSIEKILLQDIQKWFAINNAVGQLLNYMLCVDKIVTRWKYSWFSSSITPQVKQARNQPQNFNRKSILRNTTHRQSLHLQTVLTGETLKG